MVTVRSWQRQQEHPRLPHSAPRPVPDVPKQSRAAMVQPAPTHTGEKGHQVPLPAGGWVGALHQTQLALFHFSHGHLCIESLIKVQQTAFPEPKRPK